jgi:hypothetical protein
LLTATYDPTIWIEDRQPGVVTYRQVIDGTVTRRWEVHGTCDHRGDCLIGAIEPETEETIRDHAHIEELKQRLGADRLITLMDVPVTPQFDSCCGADLFTYVELPVS